MKFFVINGIMTRPLPAGQEIGSFCFWGHNLTEEAARGVAVQKFMTGDGANKDGWAIASLHVNDVTADALSFAFEHAPVAGAA